MQPHVVTTETHPQADSASEGPSSAARWHWHLYSGAVLFALTIWSVPYVLDGPSPLHVNNMNIEEGFRWWAGRLDLVARGGESAFHDGKHYNIYPPFVSILAFFGRPFFASGIPAWVPGVVLVWPLIILGYSVFFRVIQSVPWATLLTALWVYGTPIYPCLLHVMLSVHVCHVNHLYSQIGVMLILFEFLGRRRMGIMILGLVICAWTRQLMVAFAIPILWAALRLPKADRRRPLIGWGLGMALIAVVPMGLNLLKFGNPLESGYGLIAADVSPHPGTLDEWHGLFSIRYFLRNFYYMNIRIPPIGINDRGELAYLGQAVGSAIWWTTPVLFYWWIDIRRHWRNPAHRIWFLSTVPIVAGLLMYHNTGYVQKGHYRFALDFLTPMLVLSSSWLTEKRRRWVVIALSIGSLVYFRAVMSNLAPWSGVLSWRF